jgi:serine protease AprX
MNRVRRNDRTGTSHATRATAAAAALLALTVGQSAIAARAGAATTSIGSSLESIAQLEGSRDAAACGWDGKGVDVALIDTGITPVAGTGTIVNGPDLSFDAQTGGLPYLDALGHGTHLASIINGHDPGVTIHGACRLKQDGTLATTAVPNATGFAGIAPGARVVNVKVGAADGAVDPTQVLAAIDWVVQHRASDGLNIRVLAIAYGTPSSNDPAHDALSHAVDVARRNGIVVVASAGNDGTTWTDLAFPARNPNVIAVGAADTNGSASPANWTVPAFSDRGTFWRGVDLVALGVNVQGLRVPGSMIDGLAPTATGDRFVRGSGTSQATAVTAGLAAQLVQRYPTATPEQIKAMLQSSATIIKFGFSQWSQGWGAITADRFLLTTPPATTRTAPIMTIGDAPINNDRLDATIALDGVTLTGEIDVQGNAWPAGTWATAAAALSSWHGGQWNGRQFTGTKLKSAGWATAAWPSSWSGTPWSGIGGAGGTWNGLRWNGLRWNGLRWNGLRWNGTSWEGLRWNGLRWNAVDWS